MGMRRYLIDITESRKTVGHIFYHEDNDTHTKITVGKSYNRKNFLFKLIHSLQ